MSNDDNIINSKPIEYIVRYEARDGMMLGEYGIPLLLEQSIPYAPAHHIPIIGMVSYMPMDENDERDLQQRIQEAYEQGIISSYERIEKNITLKEEPIPDSSESQEY